MCGDEGRSDLRILEDYQPKIVSILIEKIVVEIKIEIIGRS